MKFTVEIELGSDVIQDGSGVAYVLRDIAAEVDGQAITGRFSYRVKDDNGNTVARFGVTGDVAAKARTGAQGRQASGSHGRGRMGRLSRLFGGAALPDEDLNLPPL